MKQCEEYFYCPNCGYEEIITEIPKYAIPNIRDGWGRPIYHFPCSKCGNLNAGCMHDDMDDKDSHEYFKEVIRLYQDYPIEEISYLRRGWKKYKYKGLDIGIGYIHPSWADKWFKMFEDHINEDAILKMRKNDYGFKIELKDGTIIESFLVSPHKGKRFDKIFLEPCIKESEKLLDMIYPMQNNPIEFREINEFIR